MTRNNTITLTPDLQLETNYLNSSMLINIEQELNSHLSHISLSESHRKSHWTFQAAMKLHIDHVSWQFFFTSPHRFSTPELYCIRTLFSLSNHLLNMLISQYSAWFIDVAFLKLCHSCITQQKQHLTEFCVSTVTEKSFRATYIHHLSWKETKEKKSSRWIKSLIRKKWPKTRENCKKIVAWLSVDSRKWVIACRAIIRSISDTYHTKNNGWAYLRCSQEACCNYNKLLDCSTRKTNATLITVSFCSISACYRETRMIEMIYAG